MILTPRVRGALGAAATALTLALIPAGPGGATAVADAAPKPPPKPANLTATRAFHDTFQQSPALATAPFYGLNGGLDNDLTARQSPPAGEHAISYTRVSGRWWTAEPAGSQVVQVSRPDRPDRLVFGNGISAVMLGAPAVADETGTYTVSTVVDPSVGDTTSQEWASIVLSRSHRSAGYVTNADVDLGLTVKSNGELALYHGGGGETAFWSGQVTPATSYTVSLTVSTGADRTVTLTVNGTTLTATAPPSVTRWPSSAFLYLGAYLQADPSKVTTFGDDAGHGLSVSRIDTSAGATARPLVDTFDGAPSTTADFGLNQDLSARQPSLLSGNYAAESGVNGLITNPVPGAVQVNSPAHPNVLSFPKGTAAVRLTKPATANLDGDYTVRAKLTPVVGSTTGTDWASLAVSRASNGTGAVDAPDVALGLRVQANGGLALHQGGTTLTLPVPTVPAAPSYEVSLTLATGPEKLATVTVNGTTVFTGATTAELPRDGYVVLGSHTTAPGRVTTVDDLRISMLGGLGYYGYYGAVEPLGTIHPDYTREFAGWTNFNGYGRDADDVSLDFLDRCLPVSCVLGVNPETVTPGIDPVLTPKPDDVVTKNLDDLKKRIGANLDKIGAVYLTDEAYYHRMSPAQAEQQAKLVRAAFPDKLLIFDYAEGDILTGPGLNLAPTQADIVGFNRYCQGRDTVQNLLEKLRSKLTSANQHLMLYPEVHKGSTGCGDKTDAQMAAFNAEYEAVAAQDPRVVYLHPFRWVDNTAATLPLTAAHEQAAGRAIVNATPTRRPSSVGVYQAADRSVTQTSHNGVTIARATLGAQDDVPLVGHWNGPGVDTIGYYRPSTREFFLPGPDGTFGTPVKYGNTGDIPVVGDWSGRGKTTIGVYRPSDQFFYLSDDNATVKYPIKLGNPDWKPLVGDWDGNGTTTVAVYDPQTRIFHLNNSNETENVQDITYGNLGDIPVKGDWDGTGIDSIGVYRPSDGSFSGAAVGSDVTVYRAAVTTNGTPLVGNWG
ncbi:hypothetical protein ABZW10_18395 [Kitasatospora sp. NPDC004723]|uniref:hypothetical protein n=1 Tax=Kitasatospora sp. NPDC004723 TaxID=3154288 RepID=UPI0033A51DEA